MIQFINVTKEYRNGTVGLRNINVKIEDGEFAFLVGASGAGKSTFTKLLIREITPSSGSIMINGKGIHRLKKKEIPYFRRNIGFVFQNFRLLSDRTALENVAFAMEALGYSKQSVNERAMWALERMGLEARAGHFPAELSGGEQQRVAIARAIVNDPTILVADEPTGNLDYETSREIMNILYEINESGTTVLMATHDREIVEKSHHRILTLAAGELVGDDNLAGGYSMGQSTMSRSRILSDEAKNQQKWEFHRLTDDITQNSRLAKAQLPQSSKEPTVVPQPVVNYAKDKQQPKAAGELPENITELKPIRPDKPAANETPLNKPATAGEASMPKTKPSEADMPQNQRSEQIREVLAKSQSLNGKGKEQPLSAPKVLSQPNEAVAAATKPAGQTAQAAQTAQAEISELEKLILEAFK